LKLRLERVVEMPKTLQPGVLYVSARFCTAAHLCACGCGAKVRTPLGPTEWSLSVRMGQPTLRPSIGNWQLPCQSHYLITEGQIEWAEKWSPDQIAAGRQAEEARRRAYYDGLATRRNSPLNRAWRWIKKLVTM
jgi:hypothetical protein